MTDTAIPQPDVPPLSAAEKGELDPGQKQRVAALDVARATLISRPGLFSGTFDVYDLITVAEWVLNISASSADHATEVQTSLHLDPVDEGYAGDLPAGLEHVATFKPSALDDAPSLTFDGDTENPRDD